MAHQHVGLPLAKLFEGVMQLEVDLGKCAGFGSGVAPCVPGAVVGADARKSGDLVLDKSPVEGEVSQPVFDDHGWAAMAAAEDVKLVSAQVNQLPGRLGSGTLAGREQRKNKRGRETQPPGESPDCVHRFEPPVSFHVIQGYARGLHVSARNAIICCASGISGYGPGTRPLCGGFRLVRGPCLGHQQSAEEPALMRQPEAGLIKSARGSPGGSEFGAR